jgi:TRAP-type uncharacterized transport system fused permease subunit
MIWYILDSYKIRSKDYEYSVLKDISVGEWITLIGAILSCAFIIINYIVGVILAITFLIALYINVSKNRRKNYKKNLNNYHLKLECLRKTLKEEQIDCYSKIQVNQLVEKCENSLPSLRISDKLFKPIVKTTTLIIIPLGMFCLGKISGKMDIDASTKLYVLIIGIILFCLGCFYMISQQIKRMLDKEYSSMKYLKSMLEDILLIDFK